MEVLALAALILIPLAIALALFLVVAFVTGAVHTFVMAGQSGFVGIALYIILWVIASPVMLVICLALGVLSVASKENPE